MKYEIEIYENNVWATDALYRNGGWQTGAALAANEDDSAALYAQIEAALEAGNTSGTVGAFAWQVA